MEAHCAAMLLFAHTLAHAAGTSYESDLQAFFEEVDASYPFFDLKGNRGEWNAAKARAAYRVGTCEGDDQFLALVNETIGALHDSHMYLTQTRVPPASRPKEYYPGVGFMPATDNRVVVMGAPEKFAASLPVGTVVSQIDGVDARKFLDDRAKEAWKGNGVSSHQRTRLYEYRIPLRGEEGAKHTLGYLKNGQEETLEVVCDIEASGWPHVYNLPADLTQAGRSFYYTKLPGGAGYMYIRRVDDSAAPGMKEALEAHPDAKGWVVDLRGNGGGGYDDVLLTAVQGMPRPVAVLIDAGCMSAGETLARDFAKLAEARLFGEATAGASSSKRTWTFPSGIASVVMSTRSRWRNDGQPIEFNGVLPDVEVEAVPDEVLAGKNSAILRAEEWLAEEDSPPP